MIISDGTTDLTFTTTFTEPAFQIDQTHKMSSGGSLKSQIRGERYVTVEKIRMTGAQVRSFNDLITNESNFYFYTPTTLPDYMTAADFPMKVQFRKIKRDKKTWNGQEIYYITLTLMAVDYQ
jgi:hypothetical protein